MTISLEEKVAQKNANGGTVVDFLRQFQRVIVAFSGGLDSGVVLYLAQRALGPESVLAVTSESASLPSIDRESVLSFVHEINLPLSQHRFIVTSELNNPDYAANSGQRCYHCKTELYRDLENLRAEFGFDAVLDGANLSDIGDYRPGMQAAKERKVVSPLLECGLDKVTVRQIARDAGLNIAEKPASACLASRVPHGTAITGEILQMIDAAERGLRELGFAGHRVRYHKDVARIEFVDSDIARAVETRMRERIVEQVKAAGFRFVSIDLEGYRTGSMNYSAKQK